MSLRFSSFVCVLAHLVQSNPLERQKAYPPFRATTFESVNVLNYVLSVCLIQTILGTNIDRLTRIARLNSLSVGSSRSLSNLLEIV